MKNLLLLKTVGLFFFVLSSFFFLSTTQKASAQIATDATLIVKKVVYDTSYNANSILANDSTNFQFSVNGQPTTIAGNQQQTFQVSSGTNTVVELPDSNYTFWGCSADSAFTKDTPSNGLSVNISSGQTVTVTCVNSQKFAQITVQKVVLDFDSNRISDNQNFTVQLNGGNDRSISQSNPTTYGQINPGTNTISELSSANYDNLGCKLPNGDLATNFNLLSNDNIAVVCTNKQKPGKIIGSKFKADGVSGISGWGISLVKCDNNFANCVSKGSQNTNSNGNYEFTNLSGGNYQVSEEKRAGYTALGNTSYNVTVTPNSSATENFSNFKNVNLTVCVASDADGNLLTTADQTPLPGWLIHVTHQDQNGLFYPTFNQNTQGNGCTTYSNEGPGTYVASEDFSGQPGWVSLSNPGSNAYGFTNTQYGDPSFTSVLDETDQTYTFVNVLYGSLTVHKMLDSTGNGTYANADGGTLFNWNLDGAGVITFGGTVGSVLAGNHTVSESSVSGYHFTGWYQTSDTSKTCANTPNKTLPITVNVLGNQNNEITLCNQINPPTGGTITIDKITLPSGDKTKFKIDLTKLNSSTILHESVLADADTPDTYSISSGNYTIKEQSTKGWTLAFTYCVSSNKNHSGINISNFSITSGEHIVCSIVNVKTGNLSLSQIQKIINDLLALLQKLFGH
ncbi:MAG TPA: SpaA isopeptide-forming pilin-related protein [Candidatus Sulfotelmatobacter sp.]|nr:SpaA isopeptide-forming pilin-related protein [Candidatus Sulfotelmatobacter sp.]